MTAYQVGVFALVRQRDTYLIVRPRAPLLPGGLHGLPGLVLNAASGDNIVESQLRRALLSQVGLAVAQLRLVGSHAARGVQGGHGDARLNLIFGSEYCSYGLRLKGVENTWKSEGSEKEKNGFRTWSVEIGAVPISTRNKRNPYQAS
ncbi:NUDIX hydrolase [Deinococcus saxicola]|uniref:hypothetical protein n=1 Tax=Deinococcus saxicola TaxID=249406 RepID=UPI0039EE0EF5